MLCVFVSDVKANKKPNKGKTPKTQKPETPKPQRNLPLKRVSILYFTKEMATAIVCGSNHLVSICIVVVKLNPTIFASVTMHL